MNGQEAVVRIVILAIVLLSIMVIRDSLIQKCFMAVHLILRGWMVVDLMR